jgi:hypothetical protein
MPPAARAPLVARGQTEALEGGTVRVTAAAPLIAKVARHSASARFPSSGRPIRDSRTLE